MMEKYNFIFGRCKCFDVTFFPLSLSFITPFLRIPNLFFFVVLLHFIYYFGFKFWLTFTWIFNTKHGYERAKKALTLYEIWKKSMTARQTQNALECRVVMFANEIIYIFASGRKNRIAMTTFWWNFFSPSSNVSVHTRNFFSLLFPQRCKLFWEWISTRKSISERIYCLSKRWCACGI